MADVVGVDLSLTSTGLASAKDGKLVGFTRVQSKGKATATPAEKAARLIKMHMQIMDWVLGDDVDLVVIESPSYGSTGGQAHERAGLWWQVVRSLVEEQVPIATVAPTTLKVYATGDGRADKETVLAHIIHRYQDQLEQRIGNQHDVADAITLTAMGARHLGAPVDTDEHLGSNVRAMDSAKWPTTE